MNISNEQAVMIFKREYQGNTFYSLGLSKKNQDNTYTNGYMPCQFKKGAQLEDRTKIYIKKAWLSFYLKDVPNSDKKQTMPYIFISEFVTLDETIENAKQPATQTEALDMVMKEEDPFSSFASEVEIDENSLPF